MALDLFAGIPISSYDGALTWYERLLDSPPSFLPNEIEAVWEVAEHRYLYIVVRPEDAGHAVHTLFVDDFDTRLAEMAERGLEAAKRRPAATRSCRRKTTGLVSDRQRRARAPV